MEQVTRFRWKLEREAQQGIQIQLLKENEQILVELRNHPEVSNASSISGMLNLLSTEFINGPILKIAPEQVEQLIGSIFEAQEWIHRKMLTSGVQNQLLQLIARLGEQLVTIRHHLVNNVWTGNIPTHRLVEMEQIETKLQELGRKLQNRLRKFLDETDLDQKERLLNSMGKLFNGLRDVGDQIRNVVGKC